MKRMFGICILLLFTLVFASTLNVKAYDEYYVDDDFDENTQGWGTTHFDNIQDGIDATTASNYDKVWVYAGDYYEAVRASNKPTTKLKAVSGNTVRILHTGKTKDQLGGNGYKCGIQIYQSDDFKMTDIIIKDALAIGIDIQAGLTGCDGVTILRCKVNNAATIGICTPNGDDLYIEKTEVINCAAGIRFSYGTDVSDPQNKGAEIYDCQINNNDGDGIHIMKRVGNKRIIIENCRMYSNGGDGIEIAYSDCVLVKDCIIENNTLYGVRLRYIPESGEDGQGYTTVRIKYSNIMGNKGSDSADQVYDGMERGQYDGALWDYNYFSDWDGIGYYDIPPTDDYHAWNSRTTAWTITIDSTGPFS